MRPTGKVPVIKHAAIAERLRAQIKRGNYTDRLPSRKELAHLFHVNLKTMDKALVTLRKERVVLPCNGLGLFVHPRLKGRVVSECFLVFPGHRALTDAANPSRFWLAHVLEQLLNVAHDLHVELRFLPISPLNNAEINWTLLQHLKKDDYVFFIGVQYWNVIRKLAKQGCRCLVLCGDPTRSGWDTAGMSLMSVNTDYPRMMQTVIDYFLRHGCRHSAVMPVNPVTAWWPSMMKELAKECRQRQIKCSLLGSVERLKSDDEFADYCGQLLQATPPVDAIFAPRNFDACRMRDVLDRRFPARSPAIRILGISRDYDPQCDGSRIDWLGSAVDEMILHLLKVVCGALPFKAGLVPFSSVLGEEHK